MQSTLSPFDKADHRPSSSPYLDKVALDDEVVRSLLRKCQGKAKKDSKSGLIPSLRDTRPVCAS